MTRSIHVTIRDIGTIRENPGMKGRHFGGRMPFIEQIHGDNLHQTTDLFTP
jgi:hypothetical protein